MNAPNFSSFRVSRDLNWPCVLKEKKFSGEPGPDSHKIYVHIFLTSQIVWQIIRLLADHSILSSVVWSLKGNNPLITSGFCSMHCLIVFQFSLWKTNFTNKETPSRSAALFRLFVSVLLKCVVYLEPFSSYRNFNATSYLFHALFSFREQGEQFWKEAHGFLAKFYLPPLEIFWRFSLTLNGGWIAKFDRFRTARPEMTLFMWTVDMISFYAVTVRKLSEDIGFTVKVAFAAGEIYKGCWRLFDNCLRYISIENGRFRLRDAWFDVKSWNSI